MLCNYWIPLEQLSVRMVTRPPFSLRLRGVVCETIVVPVELTECNFYCVTNHNFCVRVGKSMVRGTSVLQRHGLKQNCLASILTLNMWSRKKRVRYLLGDQARQNNSWSSLAKRWPSLWSRVLRSKALGNAAYQRLLQNSRHLRCFLTKRSERVFLVYAFSASNDSCVRKLLW